MSGRPRRKRSHKDGPRSGGAASADRCRCHGRAAKSKKRRPKGTVEFVNHARTLHCPRTSSMPFRSCAPRTASRRWDGDLDGWMAVRLCARYNGDRSEEGHMPPRRCRRQPIKEFTGDCPDYDGRSSSTKRSRGGGRRSMQRNMQCGKGSGCELLFVGQSASDVVETLERKFIWKDGGCGNLFNPSNDANEEQSTPICGPEPPYEYWLHHDHELVKSGHVVFQGKSSCFSALWSRRRSNRMLQWHRRVRGAWSRTSPPSRVPLLAALRSRRRGEARRPRSTTFACERNSTRRGVPSQ